MSPRPYRLGRRKPAAQRTRARVLRAARELLTARAGAEPFSVEAVARRARVARMTVYHQFGSRRGWRLGQRYGRPAHEGRGQAEALLYTLTSFETFDMLAGPRRKLPDVAGEVLFLARAAVGHPRDS